MTDSDPIAVGKSGSTPMPPYTAFASFKSAIAVLAEHGVPSRIDRSVWGNKFSGSVGSQILTALRFLRLMDPNGAPTTALKALADAYGKEHWATDLKIVIEAAYGPVLDLDLQTATANQLYERFRTQYGADGETGRKCVTFFLHAAKEAAIAVSAYLLTNVKPRASGGSSRRKPRPQGGRRADEDAGGGDVGERDQAPPPAATMTDRLLDKFPEFDPSWPDEIKTKWFAGFADLMERTKT